TEEFSESQREGIKLTAEVIWQWGVDGIEERRQLVGRLWRGQGFIHVYRCGDDLFVGWDTHANAGDRAEKDVAAGIVPRTGACCPGRGKAVAGGILRTVRQHPCLVGQTFLSALDLRQTRMAAPPVLSQCPYQKGRGWSCTWRATATGIRRSSRRRSALRRSWR